ncbi:MAG: hypothetical protein II968_02305 [Selenomonadaceae bacterium]|nr:hypothetical protein [Selenomonadaceae bacterium]
MEGQAQFQPGTNELTNTLTGMIKGIANQPPVIQFGIINSDYSLSINGYKCPIPKSEYSVCRSLLYNPAVPLTETYTDGGHTHYDVVPYETHKHQVRLPKKMRWLKPWDKVLVAIIGNEFVVIDIVFNAQYLGSGEPNWS